MGLCLLLSLKSSMPTLFLGSALPKKVGPEFCESAVSEGGCGSVGATARQHQTLSVARFEAGVWKWASVVSSQ